MRICLISTLFILLSATFYAQPRASVSYATFMSEGSPYVEVYVTVERKSLKAASATPPAAEFTLIFKQEDKIIMADKVRLIAPEGDSIKNFMEALRYPIQPGNYQLSLEGVDVYAPAESKTLKLSTPISVDLEANGSGLSDIVLLASTQKIEDPSLTSGLQKSGQLLEPLPQNFVRRQMSSFIAYIEAYAKTDLTDRAFLLEYSVVQFEDGSKEPKEVLRKNKRFSATESVTPFFIKVPTTDFESGQYALRLTLRDRTLQALAKRATLFTLANPSKDVKALAVPTSGYESSWVHQLSPDSLEYALRAIVPVVPTEQSEYINQVISQKKPEAQRLALYNHFLKESDDYPEVAYNAYMKVAKTVDKAFESGFGKGFQSDRGHIFLKYGMPDDRVIVNEDPSAPPYEIWVYNFVERTQQSPGKFLFYNPILDNASYVLLHSNVRGEIFEPRWRRLLYSRSSDQFEDLDSAQGTDVGDHPGRYADQYFTDF